MVATLEGFNTAAQYIGDIPALGSITLTELARSFEEIETYDFSTIFPPRNVDARTIRIEQIIEGLGIMPPVKMGVPAGAFLDNSRVIASEVSPILFRMDDFLDQGLINQLRKPGTSNDVWSAEEIVADRVRQMMNYRRRTMDFYAASMLTGGISYTDPRTNVTVNVSANIPAHNLFAYDGFSSPVTADVRIPNTPFSAYKTLTSPTSTRNEGLLFTNANSQALVPWTHPTANVARTVRLIKQFFLNTNKNKITDIFMGDALYALLHENEMVKAHASFGVFGSVPTSTANGQVNAVGGAAGPMHYTFNQAGEIATIGGVRVNVVTGMYRDPVSGTIKNYWPANKVVLLAAHHFKSTSTNVGYMYHCVGESPDATPGLWMRTGPDQQPPAVPGRTMQMGDAFLPVIVYPHWVCVLTVCDSSDLTTSTINANLGFGTF
jgi:hypothetical protein